LKFLLIAYNLLENDGANYSSGILSATLIHQEKSDKSIDINWSPPSVSCLRSITGLWVRVYESGTDPTLESYLNIPKKCLKSKNLAAYNERESLSIRLSSSSNSSTDADECNFSIQTLVVCRSYQVEVVPNYQGLRGKSILAEIVIPPTMDSVTRLEPSMNASILFDSMTLSWEDLSGCASRLTSINIRLWPDGVMPSKKGITDDITDKDQVINSPKSTIDDPIIYNIPRSCLKQFPVDGNIFSMTLSSSRPCLHVIRWIPLDKCRKYALEIQAQYSSSSWTGPTISQIVFTSTQGSSF